MSFISNCENSNNKKYIIVKKRSIKFNVEGDIVSDYEDVEYTDDENEEDSNYNKEYILQHILENENYEKIQAHLIKNYDSDDVIKSVLQINFSTKFIIEINKCINKNEVIIIIYKTGNVYTMKLTPILTLKQVIDFMLYETSCFINDSNKYEFVLDKRWFCELHKSTFEILHMPFTEIELAQGDLIVTI